MDEITLEKLLKEFDELVLDSSVLISYFMGESKIISSLLDNFIFNEDSSIILYSHHLMKAELYYILCRRKNRNTAEEVLKEIDKILILISEKWLFETAGKIKCSYPISISDCFSISLGILKNCPILFLEEEELSKERTTEINKEYNSQIKLISR
jgi:predicted nucleic acid-binding protein